MIRAGKLDRTITVQRETETISLSGAVASAWATVATVRAELLQNGATEAPAALGEAETGKLGFRIRWLAGLTTANRIAFAGDVFGIVELRELGRRRGLELLCERVRT